MEVALQAHQAARRTARHTARRRTLQARHIPAAHHVVAIRQVHLAVATRQDQLPSLRLHPARLAAAATHQVASSVARLQRAAAAASAPGLRQQVVAAAA